MRSAGSRTLAGRLDLLRFRDQYDDPQASAGKAEEFVRGTIEGTRVFEVADAGTAVGHLWWSVEGENAAVLDVRLDEPDRMGELLPQMLDLARADGTRTIGSGGTPVDPSRMALGRSCRASVPAPPTWLLPLDEPIADPGGLAAAADDAEAFDEFRDGLGGRLRRRAGCRRHDRGGGRRAEPRRRWPS